MTERVWYVYGVVTPTFDLGGAPAGMDDAAVALLPSRDGALAALASALPAAAYDASVVEAGAANLEWLGPRAAAHDRVLTWACDRGAVVPFPLFSLFSGEPAVTSMLAGRHDQLAAALAKVAGAREYTLRVFKSDAALERSVGALSPEVQELERQAAAAPPGQRYLLQRKIAETSKREAKRVGREVAAEMYQRLAAHAAGAVTDPLPAAAESAGTAVLNASFLVPDAAARAFRAELTALADRHRAHGFAVEFTGPWPPYHFVRDPSAGATPEAAAGPAHG
jgi:gas vesicle protein GvpL/GvpF